MCVSWPQIYTCDHSIEHIHHCYQHLLERPCGAKHTCRTLNTTIVCPVCLIKEGRRIEKLGRSSSKVAMKRMLKNDKQEQERLEEVVRFWRQKVAATVSVGEFKAGKSACLWRAGLGYIWTEEWKEGWMAIVEDEIKKRRNSTSTDSVSSTLSLSTASSTSSGSTTHALTQDIEELSMKSNTMDKHGTEHSLKSEINEHETQTLNHDQ